MINLYLHSRICVNAKLGVISAFLALGMIGYLIVEWLIRKNPGQFEKENSNQVKDDKMEKQIE